MTTNDAAAVLEHIIEKRGAEWVASNWGLDREQLARWYEGQEELPPEMVLAMRVWVSAVKRPKADVGCFEDSDHPPKPTIKWDDAVAWAYDGGQITIRMAEDQEDARRMSLMDLMAGKAKISVELDKQGEWIGQWTPVDADDHPPEVPEDVTETGWRAVPMSTVGRGEALWDVYRSGLANLSAKELNQMEEAAWAEAGKRHGVDALKEHGFLPDIMPITAWDIGGSWASIVDALADVVRSAIEEDDR
jgi:hypothetical protein